MSVKKTFLGVELSSSKKVNKLAKVMLFLLAISGIGMWLSYQQYDAFSPPMFIDSSPKYGVVFNVDKNLYLADENEKLVQSASYKQLGLKEVSDVKFFDNNILLVQANGAIKQCDFQLTWCKSIGILPSKDTDIIQRIIVNPNQKTFYTIQTNNSRIDKFDSSGNHLYRLALSTSDLKYPGGGMALSDNLLLLSDPKHKRVTIVQDKEKNNTKIIYTLSTKKSNGYTKVFSVKLDSLYRLWINLANEAYTKSSTIIINSPALLSYLVEKVPLPTTKDKIEKHTFVRLSDHILKYPVSLVAHREGALIADEEEFNIFYAQNENSIIPFGDTKIRKILENVRKNKSFYWYMLLFFGLIGIIGMLFGFIGASVELKELAQDRSDIIISLPEEKIIHPNEKGVIWLETTPAFKKSMRTMRWVLLGTSISLIPITLFLLSSSNDIIDSDILKIIGMESIFIIVALVFFKIRTDDQALGTDGKYLFIRTIFGKYTYAPIEEVICVGTSRIIVNKKTLGFYTNKQEIFDKDQLEHYIVPLLLKKAKKMNEFELLNWQMKYDFWTFIWLPILVIITAIAAYYTY